MSTVEDCERALATLADRLAKAELEVRRRNAFDRSLSCRLTDLDVVFGGQLRDGLLTGIRQVDEATAARAQVKLAMTSDDLIKLVNQELNLAAAWAGGRIKVDARVFDLIKLRSVF